MSLDKSSRTRIFQTGAAATALVVDGEGDPGRAEVEAPARGTLELSRLRSAVFCETWIEELIDNNGDDDDSDEEEDKWEGVSYQTSSNITPSLAS